MKLSRAINIPLLNSFFLFGPRGTGKTSLLETVLPSDSTLFIDLLNQELLGELQAAPNKLNAIIAPAIEKKYWIVIDEVQRVPQLLDIVHHHIERSDARFALTGSSARKLRRGAANLLAGRAYVFRLFPFLAQELGDNFTIEHALRWGTLPRTYGCPTDEERSLFLKSYTETYLQEEIVAEQAIRNLPPFRRFLQIASQTNATVVNFSKVADIIQTDPSNVKNYFQILEDTFVGFLLEPFHFSLRKRQRKKPKFYWFDCGVCRALSRVVDLPLHPSTYEYGRLFETFVIF